MGFEAIHEGEALGSLNTVIGFTDCAYLSCSNPDSVVERKFAPTRVKANHEII